MSLGAEVVGSGPVELEYHRRGYAGICYLHTPYWWWGWVLFSFKATLPEDARSPGAIPRFLCRLWHQRLPASPPPGGSVLNGSAVAAVRTLLAYVKETKIPVGR